MKKIAEIIANYSYELIEVEKSQSKESKKLKKNIHLTKECLHKLRLYVRKVDFPSEEAEINFFKYQKPFVYGNLKYYSHLHKYHLEKPKSNYSKQKKLIKGFLDKLESRKNKQITFFRYYEQDASNLDHFYFLRRNTQLELSFETIHLDREPEFSTTHDLLAAKMIAYNLLTKYYAKELIKIRQLEIDCTVKEVKPAILKNLSWTASKTDLTELLYALDASGALRNGKTEMKKLSNICQELFDIDLGNIYKTYGEIKMRGKDTTKFLDKLKVSLIQKINSEY